MYEQKWKKGKYDPYPSLNVFLVALNISSKALQRQITGKFSAYETIPCKSLYHHKLIRKTRGTVMWISTRNLELVVKDCHNWGNVLKNKIWLEQRTSRNSQMLWTKQCDSPHQLQTKEISMSSTSKAVYYFESWILYGKLDVIRKKSADPFLSHLQIELYHTHFRFLSAKQIMTKLFILMPWITTNDIRLMLMLYGTGAKIGDFPNSSKVTSHSMYKDACGLFGWF